MYTIVIDIKNPRNSLWNIDGPSTIQIFSVSDKKDTYLGL